MITTVTLNAAIDKTYYLKELAKGQVSRVTRVFADAGGKGINVARVAHLLGVDVVATGFVGGYNGQFITKELDQTGIRNDFVRVAGESRLCLTVIEEAASQSTELLEPGPIITVEAMQQLVNKVAQYAAQSSVVCLSGSLPTGVPSDFYGQLVSIIKEKGALAFLDASGDALRQGIWASPSFIKPNETEIAGLLGYKVPEDAVALLAPLQELEKRGIDRICVSLGEKGSVALLNGSYYEVKAPSVAVKNTVGCGDAFVAGMAAGISRGFSPDECLAFATASGSANAMMERAGYVDTADVERLAKQVEVRKL